MNYNAHILLFAYLLPATFVITFANAATSFSTLVAALSLAPFTVNGRPIPLTNMILLEKVDYIDRSPLADSPSVEVFTLNVVVANLSLVVRSGSASTEQTNTTDTDTGEVDHDTATDGSISRGTIITIVFCTRTSLRPPWPYIYIFTIRHSS